jgi:N-acetylneuraminic acid mutarotase
VLVGASLALAATAAADRTRWLPLHPAPSIRVEVAAARIATRIYVAAGFVDAVKPATRLDIYDIPTDRWTTGAPMPVSLNHTTAVTHDGKLYLVDGYMGDFATFMGGDGLAVAILLEYDPATDKWRTLPSPPTKRGAVAAGVIGDELYVAGGWNTSSEDQTRLEVYDFDTGKWRRGPDMRFARNHVVGAAASGKFYAVGGHVHLFITDQVFSYVERFDPKANRWERVADLNPPRSGAGVTTVDGRLVVFGGEAKNGVVASAAVFDPLTGLWSPLPDMLTPRHALGSVTYGNRVYAIQGARYPAFVRDTDVLEYLDIAPAGAAAPKTGRPRLRLSVGPRRAAGGVWTHVRFRVTSRRGGRIRPVSGATVHFAGSRLRADRRGRATLVKRLWRPGVHRAVVKKRGWRTAAAALRVSRRVRSR